MLHIEKNMCTKRDKKQNTFKLTNTSNPHKIIVKLKCKQLTATIRLTFLIVLLTFIASTIQCVYLYL